MTALPPRFPITRTEIERVVTAFYAEIRVHPVLGPVFNGHVGTGADVWQQHEAKIARFWANAILHERDYGGNPMQEHLKRSDVQGGHFTDWLALFDEVLARELAPETAQAFSALAHRIGRGLRLGLEERDRVVEAPPRLI